MWGAGWWWWCVVVMVDASLLWLGVAGVCGPRLPQERERMLRQYFQQHIVDRAAGDVQSVVLNAGPSTKPGDSTKQLSRKASSAAAVDGAAPAPSLAGDAGATPVVGNKAVGSGVCSCRRGGVAAIHIAPGLDLSASIREVGVRTQGFSGRELSKLVLKMQVGHPHSVCLLHHPSVLSALARLTLFTHPRHPGALAVVLNLDRQRSVVAFIPAHDVCDIYHMYVCAGCGVRD